MSAHIRSSFARAALLPLLALCLISCKVAGREETVGAGLTGLDHLAAHLSIQNFSVNGTHGHQAGRGGRTVCCVSLPAKWRSGLTVKVQWAVTNWKRRVYTYYEREVPVEPYEEIGNLYVHFLRNGDVRVVTSMYAAWGRGGYYPGPSYDTVLDKQPWTDYKRAPGEPEFTEVPDAMKDEPR